MITNQINRLKPSTAVVKPQTAPGIDLLSAVKTEKKPSIMKRIAAFFPCFRAPKVTNELHLSDIKSQHSDQLPEKRLEAKVLETTAQEAGKVEVSQNINQPIEPFTMHDGLCFYQETVPVLPDIDEETTAIPCADVFGEDCSLMQAGPRLSNFLVDSSFFVDDLVCLNTYNAALNASHGESKVLSGHGGFKQENGAFVIPEGVSLTFYAMPGQQISNELGNLIEAHQHEEVFHLTYTAGQIVPNYTLAPPKGLLLFGQPVTVDKPTLLSELVEKGGGRYHFAACLSFANTPVEMIYTPEGPLLKQSEPVKANTVTPHLNPTSFPGDDDNDSSTGLTGLLEDLKASI